MSIFFSPAYAKTPHILLFEECDKALKSFLIREHRAGTLITGFSQGNPEIGVRYKSFQRVGERVRIAGPYQNPRFVVLDKFRHAADSSGNDGQPECHRLQDHVGASFPLRTEDEDIGRAVFTLNPGAIEHAGKTDTIVKRRGLRFKRAHERTFANDFHFTRHAAGGEFLNGLNQRGMVFLLGEPSDRQDPNWHMGLTGLKRRNFDTVVQDYDFATSPRGIFEH